MSLINYFKEVTISWKLSLFIVVFCVWLIRAYLIFHFDPLLFTNLDLSKLALLSCAIASPFLVINTCAGFLLTYPKDKDLKLIDKSSDQLLSGTLLVGVIISLGILFIGAIATLFDCDLLTIKLMMPGIEVIVLVIIVWSKVTEDKRFKRKQLGEIQSAE